MQEKLKIKRNMISLGCVFLLALAFASGGPAWSAEMAEAVVDGLQKSYDATTDFTADFVQETAVKSLNRSLKASGKLYYKRPGKMLWRYEEPKGQFVLADGKYLYFYQPDQNQVIKSPLKNAFRGDIPRPRPGSPARGRPCSSRSPPPDRRPPGARRR